MSGNRRKQVFCKDPDSQPDGNKTRDIDPDSQLGGNKTRNIQTAHSGGVLRNVRKRQNNECIINLDQSDDEFQNIPETSRRRMRKLRENQSNEERSAELANNRTRNANKRRSSSLYLKAMNPENAELYELSDFNVICKYCSAIHFEEEHIKSSTKTENEFFDCCNYGKYENLGQLIDDYPAQLKSLFINRDSNGNAFIKDIRCYNSSFACASLACLRFNFPNKSGPPCFKIHGQIYHKFNPNAVPSGDHEIPTNGQLYFVDTETALDERTKVYDNCHRDIFEMIENCLREYYPYSDAYKMMKEVMEEQEEIARQTHDEIPELKLIFSLKEGYDPRRYNMPRVNEVAAIFVCDANGDIPPANIVVHLKGAKELINLWPLDPNVEPMIYPLFYPNNTKGWHVNIVDINNKRISLCDFIKYRLLIRNSEGKFLPHHYGKKLFQQWVVDQAARVEWNNLEYIRCHQEEIQKCNYKGLDDYLIRRSEQTGMGIGTPVILPSSFNGGPRNKDQHYMDSMAIVGEVGKPDLFITMTCDPLDRDIKKCLLHGQTASDRPDIIARVFKLKVERLIGLVVKEQLFGEVLGYCYSIEFQKRGLPHIHLLVTLHSKNKLRTKDDIDKFISAEIPDEEKDPMLYEIITRCNIHGPCGGDHQNAPCWNKNKKCCDKKFPRQFREETAISDDGYPFYKRPNDGKCVYKKGVALTNQNIVPYNAYLSKTFGSHINVEKVGDIKAVKYLYKYIFKGFDAATVECVYGGANGETQQTMKYDEVGQYLNARYLSPVEACWRLLKFELQGKSHHVERLEVHLEREQTLFFRNGADVNALREKMEKNSKLMAYFSFFNECPNAPKFKYIEMPKYCTRQPKDRRWSWPRKGHYNTIGRIYSVNPKETELYYLRYLLLHVHATSYVGLKTVNGIKYETFAQACLARGLIRDDEEWKNCLEEASHFKFPRGLRTLFTNILVHCSPKHPEKLWNQFKDYMSEDLQRRYSIETAYKKTLHLINQNLIYQDRSLAAFVNMPQLSGKDEQITEDDFFDPQEELKIAEKRIGLMNVGQRALVDEVYKILNSQNKKEQLCLYIDGPGGTGKSFVLQALYHLLRGHNKNVCNMAFSGIAATLLKKGRTVHNRFKLPLCLSSESRSMVEKNTKDAKEVTGTDVFIWDEAPMAPRFALEIVDKKLRELMKTDKKFGGKSIILSGDFRQCLPVKEHAVRSEIVDLSIKNSHLWSCFKVMQLNQNMRADPNEKSFAKELLEIGNGTLNDGEFIKIPEACICDDDLVNDIFGEIIARRDFSLFATRAILAPYNSEVDYINEEVMLNFPGEFHVFLSIDEAEKK